MKRDKKKTYWNSYQIGKWAEWEAERWFLGQRAATLLYRNYRFWGGEIDLIFEERLDPVEKEGLEIVFLEVRVRSQTGWVGALESISDKKKRCLKRTIHHFLRQYEGKAQSLRVDLLGWDGSRWEHYQNLWILD